jgi:hypothetical protein
VGNGLSSMSLESAVPEWEDERVRVFGERVNIPRASCVERRSARARSAASRRLRGAIHRQYIRGIISRSDSDRDSSRDQKMCGQRCTLHEAHAGLVG